MATRPSSQDELQRREVSGVIRASRFVRQYAHSRKQISISTVQEIHACIFEKAWPEIAGIWRGENLEISGSSHKPPHFSEVPDLMLEADKEFLIRLASLHSTEAIWMTENDISAEQEQMLDKIVETAAWIHHLVTYIHPFREGNGRTARLAANLVLERYGLVGISVKVERENKNRYCDALAQIDNHEDYEPLKTSIYEGLIDRYKGVPMKYAKNQ